MSLMHGLVADTSLAERSVGFVGIGIELRTRKRIIIVGIEQIIFQSSSFTRDENSRVRIQRRSIESGGSSEELTKTTTERLKEGIEAASNIIQKLTTNSSLVFRLNWKMSDPTSSLREVGRLEARTTTMRTIKEILNADMTESQLTEKLTEQLVSDI